MNITSFKWDDGMFAAGTAVIDGETVRVVLNDESEISEAIVAWINAGPVETFVPASISDRQFFQQLAVAGIITEAQALASNAAVIPAPLLAIIEEMPQDQQFAAKMVVSGATVFERNHPITIAIGTA